MLLHSGRVLMILHGEAEGRPPLLAGIPNPEGRHAAVGMALKQGCEFVCLLYDGYVTDIGTEIHQACGGKGCDDCRQSGKTPKGPRVDALVVLTFKPGQAPSALFQRYRQIEPGSYLFEAVESSGAGTLQHAYPDPNERIH